MKWKLMLALLLIGLVAGPVSAQFDPAAWWGAGKYQVLLKACDRQPQIVMAEFTEALSDIQALFDGPNWSGNPIDVKTQMTTRLKIALQTDENKREAYAEVMAYLRARLDLENDDAVVTELQARLDALPDPEPEP